MPKKIHFVMIGGFLGAGKTTTIARLARHYLRQAKQVGLVTNDQAYGLVDTGSLRAQGFRVGEVPGACFCCKFDELVDTMHGLAEAQQPDVVIVEPVGSCTDLVATVIEPLRRFHHDAYEIAPLAALLKPEHGTKILRDGAGSGFSPKAEYIFLKQLEEAQIAVINKTDKLSGADREQLVRLVRERFPEKAVLAISARDGTHFDQLVEALDQPASLRNPAAQVDYDIYAEGEAELGWLNASAVVAAEGRPFELDGLLTDVLSGLADRLRRIGAEPAHIKVLGQHAANFAVANLVDSSCDAQLSLASEVAVPEAELIVNARVALDPEVLESVVLEQLRAAASGRALSISFSNVQFFRPGRPVPTHRLGGPIDSVPDGNSL